MKIIFILKSIASIAGVERIISNKINYLSDHGYDVTLVTYEQGEHPIAFVLNKNIRIIDINTRFFLLNKLSLIRKFIQFSRLRKLFIKRLNKIIEDVCPDIICTTTESTNIAGAISYCTHKHKIKTIIESHVPMHSKLGYYEKNTRNLKFYINLIGKVKNIRQVKKFDQLVVLTQGDATAWSRYKRPIIIPNFINHTEYTRPKDKQCYHRIICAGRLDYEKGYDLLIRAYSLIYKNHKDWIIDIFGNGTEKDKLMNLINEIGLNEYIHINVPSSKIYDEYQKSDFLVFCSRFEGFGLVLAEAMSCSIPCVSFNCDYGPKEIIENQKDGLLVRNGDIKDLANKIEWMMTHNKEREVMGINAYHKSKKYSIEPIMEKWTKLYDEIYKSL